MDISEERFAERERIKGLREARDEHYARKRDAYREDHLFYSGEHKDEIIDLIDEGD